MKLSPIGNTGCVKVINFLLVGVIAFIFAFNVFFNFFIIMTIVLANKKKIRMIKNKEKTQILKDILDTNNSLGYRIGIKKKTT